MNIRSFFSRVSLDTSVLLGTWQAFFVAVTLVLIWIAGGFYVGFDNVLYQMVVNTGTSVVTFLMVFLIQASQNRDILALHMKLDELIRAIPVARNHLQRIEDLDEDDLKRLRDEPVPEGT